MLTIRTSEIEATCVRPSQYPPDTLPEIAFAGRSNVGKSSLLNMIVGRNRLAHVSGSPGKTRTINFYRINDEFRIVDLPGYGYAKVSKKESESWGAMMEKYLEGRDALLTVFQLVDARHDPSDLDCQMYDYLKYYDIAGPVIATKADKLSRSELTKNVRRIRSVLELSDDTPVLPASALKRTGREEILNVIEDLLAE